VTQRKAGPIPRFVVCTSGQHGDPAEGGADHIYIYIYIYTVGLVIAYNTVGLVIAPYIKILGPITRFVS
jgi:hypothetical protein